MKRQPGMGRWQGRGFAWMAWLALGMVLPWEACAAADETWDERLAGRFSRRLQVIERELAASLVELDRLPRIPLDDQGGTGGFSLVHPREEAAEGAPSGIELRWTGEPMVDLVALVPARRYDANGLDAQYGMPDAFHVELLDTSGGVLRRVATERGARTHPVRRGHPFVYRVDPPVKAAGLRLMAGRLPVDADGEGMRVHAWAEFFVFEGARNVAAGGQVKGLGGVVPPAPWLWGPAFLVDGQTPLGLPELPAAEHRNVGWLSNGRSDPREPVALTVDLGARMEMQGVCLFPAKRPTSDLPSGFGFPRSFEVAVSDDGADGSWSVAVKREMPNPGHNPVEVALPEGTFGRHVRVEATGLWKAYESYPAFFALSEVEVWAGGGNVAAGRAVRSADGMLNIIAPGGRYWSGSSLSDGFGPEGRLVPAREWLAQLDGRLGIEARRHALREERRRVIAGWRGSALAIFALLGTAGACAAIVLPVRYRVHARRELARVRERIAGDLHDEVGSNLGSIQMFADLAEGRSGPSEELKRIQRIAAETVSAVRDIVWLLRPGGDHRIATVEHLRETTSIMMESLDWHFHATDAAWDVELPEAQTRHLFLFFREALHNILRHAKAGVVTVEVARDERVLRLVIRDDGVGIDPTRLERPATLRALRQRAEALTAELRVESRPGEGTQLELAVPLAAGQRPRTGRFFRGFR